MSSFTKRVTLFLLCSAAILLLGTLIWKKTGEQIQQQRQREEARRKTFLQFQQEFQREIERAKRATADPCTTTFVDYITPPPNNLQFMPRLVLMGQEIFLERNVQPSERMWRMNYQLVPRGDRVELWQTQWMGTETPPPGQNILRQKLGEKFSSDSPKCRGK
jgi:hypothetical protein